MKRFLFLLVLAWATQAQADLYRWIDPDTGSVKFSSYPPPWYGDPEQERRAPKVQRIPERAPAQAAPTEPAAATVLERLEAQRKKLVQQLSELPKREDFMRAGAGLKQHLEAYTALAAELDRVDPKGAEARRADMRPLMDRLVEGLRTQLAPKPPAAPGGR